MAAAPDSRWELIEDAFTRALELHGPARAALLSTSFRSDPELRLEVERLLAAHDAAGDFLDPIDRTRSAELLAAGSVEDPLPLTLGRYRVLRRIGEGAMGVVYLAHDPQLDRPVALKLLRRRPGPAGFADRRLLDEARAASALDHPNVAAIHEVGVTGDGRSFIAMAYCEGESLAGISARGPLPPGEAALIARQLADALAAAHALGIVHRDVKPANIVVSTGGRVRLMDFGVAIVSERAAPHRAAGTPGYMSPEQRRGAPVGPAADVWSLGVVLAELLRPRNPGVRDPQAGLPRLGLLRRLPGVRRRPPMSGRLPRRTRALELIVERCLAPEPLDRPTAAAVSAALGAYLRQAGAGRPRQRALMFAVLAIGAIGVAVIAWFGRVSDDGPVAARSVLAVLPFVPTTPDSGLERIGRELVIALGASLDGMGVVSVPDPARALARPTLPLDADGRALARRARDLDAGALVTGQIARSGAVVRVAATVRDAASGRVVAHAAAEARDGDVADLTDSLTLALFRTPWADQALPGTAAAARGTASVPALRAFLDGEVAIAAAWFRLAPEAFARAIEADSSFWFAYWRYWYARSYHGSPVDSAIVAAVTAHRSAFPEPDRLLVEARLAVDARARAGLLRTLTERHPTYWPAWFDLGDHLTHHGPFLGTPLDEARTALRRAEQLNPGFVPTLEHLFWTSLLERDSAETGRLLARFRALRLDTLARREVEHLQLDYYAYLDHLARAAGEPHAGHQEIGARLLARPTASAEPERQAVTLLAFGFHRAQLAMSRRIIALQPDAGVAAAQVWGSALAWAGRGRWDSAFTTVRRYARTSPNPRGPVRAYGLTAAAAALGQVDPDSAALLRPLAERSEFGRSVDGRAELAWLDGLLACTRAAPDQLARQLALLEASPAAGAPALARSLAAFLDASRRAAVSTTAGSARSTTIPPTPPGLRELAGKALLRLERENAEQNWYFRHGAEHPFFGALNRLAAAPWLLAAGDTAAAATLLLLHQTDLPGTLNPLPAINQVLGTFGLALLAEIEQARGRTALAARQLALASERADLRPADAPFRTPCSPPRRR